MPTQAQIQGIYDNAVRIFREGMDARKELAEMQEAITDDASAKAIAAMPDPTDAINWSRWALACRAIEKIEAQFPNTPWNQKISVSPSWATIHTGW